MSGILDLSGKNITSIDDIKYFTGLTGLNLNNNNITDISPLNTFSNLANITNLNLSTNQISDISALSGLSASTVVDLRFNEDITDWAPVTHIPTVTGRPDYVWSIEEPTLNGTTYEIRLATELAWFAAQGEDENFVGKTIHFMNDIDMLNKPFGRIRAFAGILDGKGFKIFNLKIDRPDDRYVGLIRFLESGEIKNLTIESGTIEGNDQVGAFVGVARVGNFTGAGTPKLSGLVNKATVKGVKIVGGIIGASPDMSIGTSPNMTITNVQNHGAITGTETDIGGIIGQTVNMVTITNAGNVGQITSDLQTGFSGGIIGLNDKANSHYVYNYGTVNGKYAGSLLGGMTQTVDLEGYYLTITPVTNPIGGDVNVSGIDVTSLTEDEFKLKNNFPTLDFDNIWIMKSGASYPTLR